jgi:D-alanine-D-alanine ligase
MQKTKVAVLRGGPSSEYNVSLKSGAGVLNNLSPQKYIVYDIPVSKTGEWYWNGAVSSPKKILQNVDVVFNALHGTYGEDGKLQQLLQCFNVPYTGANALSSALGMNKILSKKIFKENGIKTPVHITLRVNDINDQTVLKIFNSFSLPCVVKPASGGSSVGVKIARTMKELDRAIASLMDDEDTILIEELIIGREATCGVIDNFREKNTYSLMPVEIVTPDESQFFDYEAKYSGISEEICPGRFDYSTSQKIQQMAIAAHKILGLQHYSRSDFIISPKRGIYLLETNSLPSLTEESSFPKSLEAVGCSLSDFFDHLITLALERK